MFKPEPGVWVPVTLLAALMGLTFYQILVFNGGHFTYALDDLYIELAMAEEILRGNYGINLGEPAAYASTILWPLLLTPLVRTPVGEWVPLITNLVCALLATYVLYGALARFCRREGSVHWRALALMGTLSGCLLFNLVAITFTGMEHVLQVLLALVVSVGLVELVHDPERPPHKMLLAALALGPLVRFEAFALTVPALVVLSLLGHRRRAALVAGVAFGGVGLFVLFLTLQGLGPVPAPLLAKAPGLRDPVIFGTLWSNVMSAFESRQGLLMILLTLGFLAPLADLDRPRRERTLAGWIVTAVALHMIFGRFGWFDRYEVYMWAAILPQGVFLYRRGLVGWTRGARAVPASLILGLAAFLVSVPYVGNIARTPMASNDIYVEHYQMHRFVTEHFRGAVAMNDVGRVSYRNDDYVLDLSGISSKRTRDLRYGSPTLQWMDDLTREAGAELAMIYLNWFGGAPATWTAIGQLETTRVKALSSDRVVTFFATRPEAASGIRAHLTDFLPTLPPGVRFVMFPEAVETAGGN